MSPIRRTSGQLRLARSDGVGRAGGAIAAPQEDVGDPLADQTSRHTASHPNAFLTAGTAAALTHLLDHVLVRMEKV
jgi:hypothetical protein